MREIYPLHKLYWQAFEELVIDICHEVLGLGATKFEDGQDGGRDSTFEGSANSYPSETDPWSGKFLIQAKHTKDPTKSCSDSDFSSDADTSDMSKEIKKVNKIKKKDGLDNYLLFTNRKTTGIKHPELEKRIRNETGLENVSVIGRQHLYKLLGKAPHIVAKYNLESNEHPIRFYEDDIKQVIKIFDENIDEISNKAEEISNKYKHLDKEGEGKKNEINKLGQEYFEYMKENSLSYFNSIEEFLVDPINKKYRKMYQNTVSDLEAKILLKRDQFDTFEDLIEDLVDFVQSKCAEELGNSRNLIRIFIHFMYFECDIGKSER